MTSQRAWTTDGPGRNDPTGTGGRGCNGPSTEIEQTGNKFGIMEGGYMPNGANQVRRMAVHMREEKLYAKSIVQRVWRTAHEDGETARAGENGKDGGASPRQAPPKSSTPSASSESTKTTKNDT